MNAEESTRAIIGQAILQELLVQSESASKQIDAFFYSATLPNARSPMQMVKAFNSMKAAPSRGIKCRAILASWADTSPQAAESLKFASSLRYAGWDCRFAKAIPIMHPKAWLFDNKTLIVGSHNSTVAGLTMTKNISLLTNSQQAIAAVIEFFDSEWKKGL
jgi:phosphatidylserine/phosphatidylglycerophosphate/cardiolipin synthase-like enzyme